MKISIRWISCSLICLYITPEISTESVEDGTPKHKLENIFTDSLEDFNYEELSTALENMKFDELKSIIEGLTNSQEVTGSRTFFWCSLNFKVKLSECSKQCTEKSCLNNELLKYQSACKSGIEQTCEPTCNPQCGAEGKCENGRCKCNPGFTGPSCDGKEDNEQECFPPCVKGKCVNDQCICDVGYTGSRCDETTKCHVPVPCGITNKKQTTKSEPTGGSQIRRKSSKSNRARPSNSRTNRKNSSGSKRRTSNRKKESSSNQHTNDIMRIIEGKEVTPRRKYPWQVGIIFNHGTIGCGGSVINSRWILTAAHCMYGSFCRQRATSEIIARVGEHDQTEEDDDWKNTRDYNVAEIVIHPGYDCIRTGNPSLAAGVGLNNDVALLRLTSDIPFNSVIRPVCLPKNDKEDYAGLQGTVSGWGNTDWKDKYSTSDFLREADLTIHANSYCFKGYGTLPDTQLCAGPTNGKSECNGDSGGPLVIKEGNKRIQIGVVSYSIKPCSRTPNSGVYARVSKYLDWIRTTIGNCKIHSE